MADERNEQQPSYDGDAVMVYINPEVLQTLADVAAKKEADLKELLSAAEEGAKAEPRRTRNGPSTGFPRPLKAGTLPPSSTWACAMSEESGLR